MRDKGIKDEWITASLHRIGSQGLYILIGLLFVSLFIKAFILKWDVELWGDSLLFLLITGGYISIRSIKEGLYLLPSKQEKIKRMKKANYIGGAMGAFIWFGLMLVDDLTAGGDINITRSILKRLVGAILFFVGITWLQWYFLKMSNKNENKKLD